MSIPQAEVKSDATPVTVVDIPPYTSHDTTPTEPAGMGEFEAKSTDMSEVVAEPTDDMGEVVAEPTDDMGEVELDTARPTTENESAPEASTAADEETA